MAISILDPASTTSINQKFRQKRFSFFKALLAKLPKPIHILDVGGTIAYWENMDFIDNQDIHITLLNLTTSEVRLHGFSSVAGNACDLSTYPDNYFDVVFSNSVIEHLFTYTNQTKMANEVRRVGKNYIIQTPNKLFPVEPHWLFPMFQFLPFSIKLFLTNNFSLGHYPKEENIELAKQRVKEVRLLTKNEMITLFPDGTIYEEKVLGFNKSFTMYRFN